MTEVQVKADISQGDTTEFLVRCAKTDVLSNLITLMVGLEIERKDLSCEGRWRALEDAIMMMLRELRK